MSAVTIERQLERIDSKGRRATVGDLSFVAEALDCPLWVMMIPGLAQHPQLLQGPGLQRLVQLLEHYLACDDSKRRDTEVVAQTGAILSRPVD